MTFGKDDGDYREYLKNGKMSRFAFLLMQQYGPWNLTKKEDVREFCQAVVALTLVANDAAEV